MSYLNKLARKRFREKYNTTRQKINTQYKNTTQTTSNQYTTLRRHQSQGTQPLYGGGQPGNLQGEILNEIQEYKKKTWTIDL